MISLCMIVKNEEKYLERCLSSIKDCVDEIVIVDTGSTDNTTKIAKRFTNKIFSFNWSNSFSEARNFSLSHATKDLILYLDADEYLHPNSKSLLTALSKTGTEKAYFCKILNINNTTKRPSIMLYPRLFPNKKLVRFTGAVHEQIESVLIENKIPLVQSEIQIIHTGYDLSPEEQISKASRNKEILEKEFCLSPNSYNAFQLAQTYGILEKHDEAEYYFSIALKDNSLRREYKSTAYRYIALKKSKEGNLSLASEYILLSIKEDNMQPLAFMAASEIYNKLGSVKESLAFCRKAFELNKNISSGKVSSFQNIFLDGETIINCGIELSILAEDILSLDYFCKQIKDTNNFFLKLIDALINNKQIEINEDSLKPAVNKNNIGFLQKILLNNKNIDLSKKVLLALSKLFPESPSIYYSIGKFFNDTSSFSEAEYYLSLSIQKGQNDPTPFIHFISVLVRNGKINQAKQTLSNAFAIFKDSAEVLQVLNNLQNKLAQLS